MKPTLGSVERYRVRHGKLCSHTGDTWGAFVIPRGERIYKVIVDDGRNPDVPEFLRGWEHVSVSLMGQNNPTETPNWEDMCFIKDRFFEPEECVVQYHPPASVYVNVHPGVLHLWKPLFTEIPMPPQALV